VTLGAPRRILGANWRLGTYLLQLRLS
jgi:hypothetical protein